MPTTIVLSTCCTPKALFPLLVFVLGFWNIVYSVTQLNGLESLPPPAHHHQPAGTTRVNQPADYRGKAQPIWRSPAIQAATAATGARSVRQVPTTRTLGAAATTTPERVWSKHHDHGKPFLVIHVGPIHTLAPELDHELTLLSSELQADGFVVADEHTRATITNYECHKQLHETRQQFRREQQVMGNPPRGDITLTTYLSSHCECWGRVLDLLAGHRDKGESLIVIDESLAGRMFHFDGLWTSTMDLIAMEETLADDWNVEIVVGYRRFAEWLPLAVESDTKQRHRDREARQRDRIMVVQDDDYSIAPALFPEIVSSAENGVLVGVNATHTREVVEHLSFRKDGPAKIPVTVLNVHGGGGPLAKTFTCHVLWYAAKACQASARLPLGSLMKHTDPVQLGDFYDFIVGDAHKHAAYRIHEFSTQVAAIAVKHYQENVLGLTASDLPTECPSRPALQRLLQLSLRRERDIQPNFAAAHSDDHAQMFWEYYGNDPRRLCTVSWKLIMRDGQWRQTLRELPHDVPKELLPHDVSHQNNEAPKVNIHNGKYKGRITVKRIRHSQ